MAKDDPKPTPEQEEVKQPEMQNLQDTITNALNCAKEILPLKDLIKPCPRNPELCEVHIVGTPEMIQKILKTD